MFIRTTKNSAGQSDYHLVESFREDGKVRQRTLLSLGRVEDGKLEQLAAAIAKHTGLLSALDIAKTVGVDNTFIMGPLLVLCGLFAKLGIDAALLRLEHAHRHRDPVRAPAHRHDRRLRPNPWLQRRRMPLDLVSPAVPSLPRHLTVDPMGEAVVVADYKPIDN